MALAGLNSDTRNPSKPSVIRAYIICREQPASIATGKRAVTAGEHVQGHPESCDVYFSLATESGHRQYLHYMSRFGFARRPASTWEGELPVCFLPRMEDETYQQSGIPAITVSVGMDRAIAWFTPCNCVATATLANNGVAFKPHLVKECKVHAARKSLSSQEALYDLNISPKDRIWSGVACGRSHSPWHAVMHPWDALSHRRQDRHGPGDPMKQGEKYDQNVDSGLRDHAWFIAFALRGARMHWRCCRERRARRRTAAPIARKVLDYYLLARSKPLPDVKGRRVATMTRRATLLRFIAHLDRPLLLVSDYCNEQHMELYSADMQAGNSAEADVQHRGGACLYVADRQLPLISDAHPCRSMCWAWCCWSGALFGEIRPWCARWLNLGVMTSSLQS